LVEIKLERISTREPVMLYKRFLKVAGDGETEIRQLYEQPAK